MSPRQLQQQIHSTFSPSGAIWSGFKTDAVNLYIGASNYADFNDHLFREFNRKVRDLNLPTDLYFMPFDGGLRFIGTVDDLAVIEPDTGLAFVYASGQQVLLNDGSPVQVPEIYANA